MLPAQTSAAATSPVGALNCGSRQVTVHPEGRLGESWLTVVARMSICIDTRVQFDEASRGAPPGGSVESVRCRSSNC